MGYKPFTAMPAAIRWGRDYEDLARCHYVAHVKQTGFKDIKVSPSGLSLILAYSFLEHLEMGGFTIMGLWD